MLNFLTNPLVISLIIGCCIIGIFPLLAGYLTFIERKVLGDFQVRLGPMRVGPHGLLQPIADAVKLLTKEDTIPGTSDKFIFWFAPVLSTFTALMALAMIPFSPWIRVADVNIGLLVISATSAVGILGIILGGWSSNSHYSLLGSLRSGAQLISYEVALGFALVCGVMAAGTLSMVGMVDQQFKSGTWGVFQNYGLMLVPFLTYLIAAVAETNRAPFDLPEAESELVAGFMTEYSGFRWALFFLAEYGNMLVISAVAVTMFWGGWLRPFPNVQWLDLPLNYGVPVLLLAGSGVMCFPLAKRLVSRAQAIGLICVGLCLIGIGLLFAIPIVNNAVAPFFWFVLKVSLIIYAMMWFRATWPRLRYDQLMNIGWKRLIPIGMGAVMANAVVGMLKG
ncbi:MAG TPA: complex I subunit 1 family protein [Bryobacteraceae bacterium]|nr:complex I subunit 1 family protein [Bryobacteraceae bacterium]